MSVSALSSGDNAAEAAAALILQKAVGAFSIELEAENPHFMHLIVEEMRTRRLWTRHFADLIDRDAVIDGFRSGALDLLFLGRATMIFGPATIREAVDGAIDDARQDRLAWAEQEARRQRDHNIIKLFARNTKHGYRLQLERRSESSAEWSVKYDRASERDRLCDWMRWQSERFASFLDHAAKHGSEALTRLLVDEMFETERRVKKEGRGAGGIRPLRMWRGD